MNDAKIEQDIKDDQALAAKFGAQGTPSFFINGKPFVGAQPYDAFKAKVEEAIKDAEAHAKGGNYAKYYDDLMKGAKTEVAAAPAAGGPAPDTKIYKVDAGDAPAVGPKSAPVQIVEFSDFQCPFCSRVVPTVKQIEDKYAGKVHLAFRNYPLPFHQNAQIAAEAGAAANAQGKFWQMHDKMFANQQALDRASLEKYAGEIGLDVGKFKADLDSGKFKEQVNKDVAYANALGTGGFGTPTFFINGHMISGAMPFENFAQVIDEELKKKKH
jgi:protein-disulfide isomerase